MSEHSFQLKVNLTTTNNFSNSSPPSFICSLYLMPNMNNRFIMRSSWCITLAVYLLRIRSLLSCPSPIIIPIWQGIHTAFLCEAKVEHRSEPELLVQKPDSINPSDVFPENVCIWLYMNNIELMRFIKRTPKWSISKRCASGKRRGNLHI